MIIGLSKLTGVLAILTSLPLLSSTAPSAFIPFNPPTNLPPLLDRRPKLKLMELMSLIFPGSLNPREVRRYHLNSRPAGCDVLCLILSHSMESLSPFLTLPMPRVKIRVVLFIYIGWSRRRIW